MTADDMVNVCKLVSYVVFSDLKLTPEESEMLGRLMDGFGLDAEQRKRAMAVSPKDDPAEIASAITGEDARGGVMRVIIAAAAADGQIADAERDIAMRVGRTLGVPEAEIEAGLGRAVGA